MFYLSLVGIGMVAAAELIELLPEGTSVAAVIVTVVIFVRQQNKIVERFSTDLRAVMEQHERFEQRITEQMRQQIATSERIVTLLDERLPNNNRKGRDP